MFAKSSTFALAAVAAFTPVVSAHGYIKEWGIQGQGLERAQKTDIKSSAFRAAPDNTGWIGSNFLNNAAITCGSSNTPGGTVAAPGGTVFASAAQSAGRELAVRPGQSLQFVISGNPGEGWPHPRGHVQTYLASCGGSCTNFDASQGKFFKIQSEANGIENTLRPAYDGSVDGNRYNVKIPGTIPDGSYIVRFELIAFGQSSPAEGQQDQYYAYCGQIKLSGSNARPNAARLSTVSFPGAYRNGNLNGGSLPGPSVLAAGTSSVGSSSGSSSSSSGKKTSAGTGTKASTSSSSSSGSIKLASNAPACAAMCLRVKISERSSLASSCSSTDGACMCAQRNTFVQAFYNCAKDNCSGADFSKAKKAFDAGCAALEDDEDEDDCDDESTKRDLQEVEEQLRIVRARTILARRSTFPLAERYPAPPHSVIRPVIQSRSTSSHLAGRALVAHGRRMLKEKRSKTVARA